MYDVPTSDLLGYTFRDTGLLRIALTHPSACVGCSVPAEHNQRLEFLGDAVLQLVLTHELYSRYPNLGEGTLTRARSKLANRRFLANVARNVGLGRFLILGRGEESLGGRERPSILADAFEAVLGAVYLDGGLEAARDFVLRHLGAAFEATHLTTQLDNPKGELQELIQRDSKSPPQYKIEKISGPDHARLFECAVYHQGTELGRGTGPSKKEAESEAARVALKRLREGAQTPGDSNTELE
ncbi:MAG: ribonuclease III [Verrucomicrobiae bacterium]|nr:ribonuclease III [Verrucomicrobiae bacterium]